MTASPASTVRLDQSDHFDRADLDVLSRDHLNPCVTMYLPTHRSGAEVEQDPIRLKNLLASAEHELQVLGWQQRPIDELLAPARKLIDDREFWRHQDLGLAVFLAPDLFQTVRSMVAFEEQAVVSSRFHLLPLVPLVSDDQAFWLLALTQNDLRLFRGGRHTLVEVDTGPTPTSLADALAHEDPERQLQVHSTGPGSTGQAHTHGGGSEKDKAALERYFRAVDRGLTGGVMAGSHAPLVLAAVDYYGPIYRGVCSYAHVIEQVVAGSPEELDVHDLHAAAWPVVAPALSADRTAISDRYGASGAHGLTAQGFEGVDGLATGQIEVLLLADGDHRWAPGVGARPAELQVERERQAGDLDLLDALVSLTFDNGGDVAVIAGDDMPDRASVAAILRYP